VAVLPGVELLLTARWKLCDDQLTSPGKSGNVRPTMRLNLFSWIVLSCLALNANAQAPAAGIKTMSISLDEAIRLVLQKNLEIRLGRTTPQVARLDLEGSYGYYDPVFTGSASQRYNNSAGRLDPNVGTGRVPGSRTWNEDFSLGINGVLPTGTRYELESSLNRLSGEGFNSTTLNYENIPFQYTSEAFINVTQPLLRNFWIDQGRLTIKLAKKEIKMSEYALQFTIMDVVNQTAAAYYDLISARDRVKVQEMALQLKDQFLSETKKKVQTGTLAALDEKQAESEAATARADLIRARSDAELAENVLKALISDDFVTLHASNLAPSEKLLAVSQQINVVESWRNGMELRPDYLRLKARLEQENIVLKFTKNQLYPSLDLTGSYGRNGLGLTTLDSLDTIADNRFPRWGGGVILTVPFTRKTERANHKIQKVNVETAILQLKRLEQAVIREIDDAVKQVRSAYAAIEATREARVFAEAALDAEQKRLENGKSTNFQVLELQDALTQARAAEIDALSDYNRALHNLYFREGSTLQRNKIQLEVK
jgi:outer membrane protein TolC